MSGYNFNAAEGHQSRSTCPPSHAIASHGFGLEGRMGIQIQMQMPLHAGGPGTLCLPKPHLRFDPDHDRQLQSSSSTSSSRTETPTNSLSNSPSTPASMYTDDLYPLDIYHAQQPHYPPAQAQQQQQHQHQHQHQHQQQQLHQQWAASDFVPVQRQVPSSRAYSYQPYPTSSPRISHYSAGATATATASTGWDYGLLDYAGYYDGLCSSPATASPLVDSHGFGSHGLYNAYGYSNACYNVNVYPQQQPQPQAQPTPTCIAPEDLFARMPMTPISPASIEESSSSSSDDRASTPSSTNSPLSARSSPTRPGLQIPTVPSLTLSTSSIAPSWTSASASSSSLSLSSTSSSSLPSPVDSLASGSSNDEPAFVPTASLKKSAAAASSSLKAKRATRSAAPEPAWVEAVLAEDAKRLQMDANSSSSASSPTMTTPRPANRPIAFACVFCRHRKIQCIRPKTDVAPGEKPAPCNQCEKRNRCCEYPPAALNPRVGRRTRPGKNDD